MERILLTGLLKIELPGRTVRLCDGGFTTWAGETFEVSDPDFGIVTGFDQLSEGVGDEAPAGVLTLAVPNTAAAATLAQPGFQNARVRMWIAEKDVASEAVVGTPDLQADLLVDTVMLSPGKGKRELSIGLVSRGQRLMLINEGNVLSPAFHRAIHPGEAGLDNATGLSTSVAWGTGSPRGQAYPSGGLFSIFDMDKLFSSDDSRFQNTGAET